MVSSVEGAQRNGIEDDYSFSTELGSAAAEAARSRRTFGENTGYGSTHPPPLQSYSRTNAMQLNTLKTD